MAKSRFLSVDDYIASQREPAQNVLQQVRAAIRKGAPKAEETISYNMPTYILGSDPLIYFAGWKEHYSLYPASQELLAAFEKELAQYEINKSTIRFPLDKTVPAKLIASIVRFRAREIRRRS